MKKYFIENIVISQCLVTYVKMEKKSISNVWFMVNQPTIIPPTTQTTTINYHHSTDHSNLQIGEGKKKKT